MLFKDEIKKVIRVYMEHGIVTNKEIYLIDNKSLGRRLEEELKERGYLEPRYLEINNNHNCTGLIYNPTKYTEEEATAYVLKNVFNDVV